MKRLTMKAASIAMAAALAFAPVAGYLQPAIVYAEDGDMAVKANSITVDGAVAGHSYKVYQIFTGTVGETTDEDGNTKITIGNAKYGSNYIPEGKSAGDTVPADELKGITDAKKFAKDIKDAITGEPVAVLTSENVSEEVGGGYYFVIDEAGDGENDAASDFIVTVAGAATFKPKSVSVPEFDKIIDKGRDIEDDKSKIGNAIDWTYTIEGNDISLKQYIGRDSDVTVYAFYNVDGQKYNTQISDNDADNDSSSKQTIMYNVRLASDEENTNNINYMFGNNENITSVTFNNGIDMNNTTDISGMFSGCTNLKSVDFGGSFNTKNVSDMKNMFKGCISLTSLHLENFDTAKAGDMSEMFSGCSSLKTIYVDSDKWNISSVGNVNNMCYECTDACNIQVSSGEKHIIHEYKGVVTKEPTCTSPGETTYNCIICNASFTEEIPAEGHDMQNGICVKCGYEETHKHNYTGIITKEPTCTEFGTKTFTCICGDEYTEKIPATGHNYDDSGICTDCGSEMDLSPKTADSEWNYTLNDDTGVITLNYHLNDNVKQIKVYSHYKIDESNKIYKAELANNIDNKTICYMFAGHGATLQSVVFSDELDISTCTDMSHMFYSCRKLKEINFGNSFNNNNVTDMSCMFSYCTALSEMIFEENFDTSNVTNMSKMFDNCSGLTNIDISNFNPINVTDMGLMFNRCTVLKTVNFGSNFNTYNLLNMDNMFNNCTSLSNLDLSGFNTCNVVSMKNMFYECHSLLSIDFSNFNTSKVETMYGMFNRCRILPEVDLTGFDTSNVTDMGSMFTVCQALTSLDLTSFDTSNVTNTIGMFSDASKLTAIYVAKDKWDLSHLNATSKSNMFKNCGINKVTEIEPVIGYSLRNLQRTRTLNTMQNISNNDTAVNYGIGDTVSFSLVATMPETISIYDTYKLAFHDTMTEGLKLDENSIEVYAGDKKINASAYTVTVDGQKLTIEIADAKSEPFSAEADTVISVKYTAELTDATAFENVNEAYLEYSNDPKSDGMGRTVSDEVTAFTFTLQFNKVDRDGDALEGAGFTLYKKSTDGEYTTVKDEVKGVTAFSFKGLAAGEYKLVESTTPDGYNTMEDLIFEIKAAAEENAEAKASVTNLKMVDADGAEIDNWNEDTATGVISSNIVNYTGATLPSTGGIGTVIFYVAGGMLVLIAGIVAVAKKKAEYEE